MKRRLRDEFMRMVIKYDHLGTVSLDELRQAILTDFECLKDQLNVRFVKEAVLRFSVTDEYGNVRPASRRSGRGVELMDTNYNRPVCKDFEL